MDALTTPLSTLSKLSADPPRRGPAPATQPHASPKAGARRAWGLDLPCGDLREIYGIQISESGSHSSSPPICSEAGLGVGLRVGLGLGSGVGFRVRVRVRGRVPSAAAPAQTRRARRPRCPSA
eukprot:scaffold39598_cov72-Phaeocystis_antarctica.AAC.1